jgi:hypothetical protein
MHNMKLPMKLLRIAGLCLVAMLAMSLVAAGSASAAAPAWEHCTKGVANMLPTKYTEHQCETLAPNNEGEWEWREVNGTEKVVSHGSLVLRDTSATAGKIKVAVSCSGENKGSVGPGKYGRITEIPETSIQCSNVENCTVFKKAEARNLPWQTELVEEAGGEIRNKITNGGAAEAEWPGWAVTCELAGAETTDRCTTNSGSTAIANQTTHGSSGTELLVLATFEAKTAKAKCSLSSTASKETGEVRGIIANLQANGWGLRIS